jgi:hypothetical protein
MPRYAITERAGRFVAGQTNTGVGTVLTLTEKQAEHELRLGTLRPLNSARAEAGARELEDIETAPPPGKKARRTTKSEADRAASADPGTDT